MSFLSLTNRITQLLNFDLTSAESDPSLPFPRMLYTILGSVLRRITPMSHE